MTGRNQFKMEALRAYCLAGINQRPKCGYQRCERRAETDRTNCALLLLDEPFCVKRCN